jgi:hypothetical protein
VIAGPGLDLRRIGRRKMTGLAGCTPDWEKKKEKTKQKFLFCFFFFLFSFFFFKKKRTKMLVTCLSLHAARIARKMKFQLATWSGMWLNATWLNNRIYKGTRG